jgi:hypothetical protein
MKKKVSIMLILVCLIVGSIGSVAEAYQSSIGYSYTITMGGATSDTSSLTKTTNSTKANNSVKSASSGKVFYARVKEKNTNNKATSMVTITGVGTYTKSYPMTYLSGYGNIDDKYYLRIQTGTGSGSGSISGTWAP